MQAINKQIQAQFISTRKAGVPLVAISTPDSAATITSIQAAYEKVQPENRPCMFRWDIIEGLRAINENAIQPNEEIHGGADPAMISSNPIECLRLIKKTPNGSIIFVDKMDLWIEGDNGKPSLQAIWNLRDTFKSSVPVRTLVMLGKSFIFPPAIASDVITLDEELPDRAQLEGILAESMANAKLEGKPSPRSVDAVMGLTAFEVEQISAMSLNGKGMDENSLWERKRKAIEQVPGLSVYRGPDTFEDITGMNQIKSLLQMIVGGKNPPALIVFMDEIEKAVGGVDGDSSGTNKDQLKVMLTEMQDNDWDGSILLGPPGTGKTALAKAMGNKAKCPLIMLDLGAMMGEGLVGQAQNAIRAAFRTIKAMAAGRRVFFIATCNSIEAIKPELRRRFRRGTFFIDLPDKEQVDALLELYGKKYGVTTKGANAKGRFNNWTGAEIKQACENAEEFGIPLDKAATFVAPVCISMGESLDALRKASSGRYLAADKEGVYRWNGIEKDMATVGGKRSTASGEDVV